MRTKRCSQSATAAVGLKRRYGDTANYARGSQDRGFTGGSNLDLSMHLSSDPFGNRYDVLRPLSHTHDKRSAQHRSSSNRWSCSSRKAKERKRICDARRHKYKFSAADILDEQLSIEFDQTLSAANIPQRSPSAQRNKATSAPSKLSHFNFGGLDLVNQTPRITSPSIPKPEPVPTPQILPPLPSCCPKIPAVADSDTKIDGFPLFFDLSRMPELDEPRKPPPMNREIQLWRVEASPQPRKQSLFFPPSRDSLPNASPLSNGLDPHTSSSNSGYVAPPSSFLGANNIDSSGAAAPELRRHKQTNAYAANLWGLLAPAEVESCIPDDTFAASITFVPRNRILAAPFGQFDHNLESVGMPVELGGVEIPFIHDNSLTGLHNGRFDQLSTLSKHNALLPNPATQPITQPPVGLNEILVDQLSEFEAESGTLDLLALPALPPTPPAELSVPIFAPHIPAKDESEPKEDDERTIRVQPLCDIQAITPPYSPIIQHADSDIIDVGDFLATGHLLECECRICQEPPELIDQESWINDDEWSAASTSAASRSPSVCSAWESEWGTLLDADTVEEEGWTYEGDVFCRKPSSVAHGPW